MIVILRRPPKSFIGSQGREFWTLYDTPPAQFRQTKRIVAKDIGQDLVGVFAERRRACRGNSIVASRLERRARYDQAVELRMLRVKNHVPRRKMQIARDLFDVGNRRARYRSLIEQAEPMRARLGREMPGQYFLELVMIRGSIGVRQKARIALQLRHRDRIAETDPD